MYAVAWWFFMTSDSDNKPDQNKASESDDFDEFDDFDDFDDFDEAAGLDAFDNDDPFADDDESDPDAALDAAVEELDAMVEGGAEPAPVVQEEAAAEPVTDNTSDEFDEFEADGFDPSPMAPEAENAPPVTEPVAELPETPVAPNESDDFEADEFEVAADSVDQPVADEFAQDDFSPAEEPAAYDAPAEAVYDAEAPVPADLEPTADADDETAVDAPPETAPEVTVPEETDADDDFADVAAAFKSPIDPEGDAARAVAEAAQNDPVDDDFADIDLEEQAETPAPEPTKAAVADGGDLDAMLAARADEASGGFGTPITTDAAFEEDATEAVEVPVELPAPSEEEPVAEAPPAPGPASFDESELDAAFEDDDGEPPAPPPLPTPEATADDDGFEQVPDPADEDAEDMLPADDAVASLADDGDSIDVSADMDEGVPSAEEPGVVEQPAMDTAEPAAPEAVAETPMPSDDNMAEEAAAAAAAAITAATMADDEAMDGDDGDEEEPAPKPKRQKRKRQRGPAVPLIDVGEDGFDRVAQAYPKRLRALHDLASRKLTAKGLGFAENLCRKWASKAQVPYRLELDGVSQALNGEPGTYVINLGFEMACTTAYCPDEEGGQRLLHTMDWKLDNLGRMMVAARRHAPAGLWVNITWPGYIGCLQGVAPGRFAAAINHAPINGKGPGFLAWPMSKMKWYGQKGIPPALLLRKVFDECESFDEAVEMIEKTPICYPAIFSLLGVEDGEFSIIERTETAKSTQKRAPAVTNHWLNKEFGGTVTAYQSEERLVAMKSRINAGVSGDEWLVHPVLNTETRLAVDLNPATGRMRVRGYQGVQPVTSLLDIYAD